MGLTTGSATRESPISAALPLPKRAFKAWFVASGGDRAQSGQPDQVVGGTGELGPELVALDADVAELATAGHRLPPAEDLLHPLAHALADQVPSWVAVRPSMALRRPLWFWATWGVTFKSRQLATKSRVS